MANDEATTPPPAAVAAAAVAAPEETTPSSLTGGKTAKELENTVLLGRGKSHLNHQGNKHFQDLIVATVDAYAKEPSVFVKRQMTMKIVEQIEQNGGFLRWSSKNGGGWETIDLEERRQKVAHALQYRIRCMNNTNGGKRARAKAMNAVKNGPLTAADLLAANASIGISKKLKMTTATSAIKALATLQDAQSAMVVGVMAPAATLPTAVDGPMTVVVVAADPAVPNADIVPSKKEAAATVRKPKAKQQKKKTKAAATTIQLTEDERSFVRSFVNNPAGPTDDEEEDDTEDEEDDSSSPAAVAATAAQLAAVTAAVMENSTVPVPALPDLSGASAVGASVVITSSSSSGRSLIKKEEIPSHGGNGATGGGMQPPHVAASDPSVAVTEAAVADPLPMETTTTNDESKTSTNCISSNNTPSDVIAAGEDADTVDV